MVDKAATYHFLTRARRGHNKDENMDQISWVGRMNRPPENRLRTLKAGYREGGVLREKKLVDGYKPGVEFASGW